MSRQLIALAAACTLFFSGCATNPVTGKKELTLIGTKQEIQLGSEQYQPLQQATGGPYVVDDDLQAYVERVGRKLAAVSDRPDLPYQFEVVNSSVPNAWALPGGKIAINRGLLLELDSEAELAAVLGHEIVHVAARHGAKNLERGVMFQAGLSTLAGTTADTKYGPWILGTASLGAGLVTMKYSRNMELEADHYGIDYMVRAGYNPHAAVKLQETFVRLANGRRSSWLEGLFASHPPSQERLERNRALAAEYPSDGFEGNWEYATALSELRASKEAYTKIDEGRRALEEGNMQLAERLATEARRLAPKEAMAYGLSGDIKLEQGHPYDAIRFYEDAIHHNPSYYYFYLRRGQAYERVGNSVRAQRDLTESLRLLPTAEAHTALGKIAMDAHDHVKAIPHLRAAAEADPVNNREALALLTRVELPEAPDRYFHVDSDVDENGYLLLKVQNRSVLAVEDVVVRVTVSEPSGQGKVMRDIMVYKRIPAGYQALVDTDIPMEYEGQQRYSKQATIKTEVMRVRVAS